MSLKKESLADARLHAACLNGDARSLRFLLDSGRVHVDSRDKDGNTPLILSAAAGHLSCCVELINQGANPYARRMTGATALFLAAQGGYLDIARALLRAGSRVNAQCNDGGTALMVAAQHGYLDVCRELLNNGANIYLQMKDGATCLFLACQNGHAKIVAMFLEHAKRMENSTAVTMTTATDRTLRTNYVDMKRNDGTTALWMAAQMGYDHIIRLLLQHGACPNLNRNDGISPLFKACHKGNVNAVRELLLFGNPSLGLAQHGECPLYAAVLSRNVSIVRLLLAAGADPHLPNKSSLSPYQLARKLRLTSIVDLFDKPSCRRGSLVSSEASSPSSPLSLSPSSLSPSPTFL